MIFKYRTLRYEFDHNGLTGRWGVLFRREITLTYARIQDIHLVSNLVERWLGLVRTVRVDQDTVVVALTREGRGLLEAHRRDSEAPARDHQAFHNGIQRPRELKHDSALYRAYLDEAERLHEAGAEIRRVVLENDLKAEYQEFLQERNRGRADADGRPDRDADEIRRWADGHQLPCDEQGHVMFPDARIEYTHEGRDQILDVEVMTPHYRGAHAASKAKAGFSLSWSGRGGDVEAAPEFGAGWRMSWRGDIAVPTVRCRVVPLHCATYGE